MGTGLATSAAIIGIVMKAASITPAPLRLGQRLER
jgi:hypothetical protein